MQRVIWLLMFILISIIARSQNIIYEEGFSGSTLPQDLKVVRNDNGIPHPDVDDFTQAWILIQIGGNGIAASTSWYQDTGSGVPQSDNWLISPLFNIGQLATLSWDARALDSQFPDGYEVWVLDAGGILDPVPSDFTTNGTLVFSVDDPPGGPGENSSWTTHSTDLFNFGFTNTDIYLAWRNNSTDQYILALDNILLKDYFNFDAKLTDLFSPVPNSCKLTDTEEVTIRVENLGLQPLDTITFAYSLDFGSVIYETAVFNPPLNTFESGVYTFGNTVDLSQDELYTLEAWAELSGDENIHNDSALSIIGSTDSFDIGSSNPYTTSFEILDFNDLRSWAWSFENVDSTGQGFGIIQADFARDGSFALIARSTEDHNEDDWAFSTCINIVAGQAYSINYYHRSGVLSDGTEIPEDFEVGVGLNPDPASMIILDSGSVASSTYKRFATTFQPAISGTYFIGIHRTTDTSSGPGSPFLYIIDEFAVEELQPPTAAFSITVGSQDSSVTIINNSAGDGNSYLWEWGDGESSTLESPVSYQYSDTGTYEICLTATNFAGSDQNCQTVTIEAVLQPVADFDVSINVLSVTLTDKSQGSINSWMWNLGDGNTAVGPGPVNHTYATANTYIICLNVSNSLGSDSICDTFTITGINDPFNRSDDVKIFPNPSKNTIFLDLPIPFRTQLQMRILDVSASFIYDNINLNVTGGETAIIDVGNLTSGSYVIRLTSASGFYALKRFVIVRQ